MLDSLELILNRQVFEGVQLVFNAVKNTDDPNRAALDILFSKYGGIDSLHVVRTMMDSEGIVKYIEGICYEDEVDEEDEESGIDVYEEYRHPIGYQTGLFAMMKDPLFGNLIANLDHCGIKKNVIIFALKIFSLAFNGDDGTEQVHLLKTMLYEARSCDVYLKWEHFDQALSICNYIMWLIEADGRKINKYSRSMTDCFRNNTFYGDEYYCKVHPYVIHNEFYQDSKNTQAIFRLVAKADLTDVANIQPICAELIKRETDIMDGKVVEENVSQPVDERNKLIFEIERLKMENEELRQNMYDDKGNLRMCNTKKLIYLLNGALKGVVDFRKLNMSTVAEALYGILPGKKESIYKYIGKEYAFRKNEEENEKFKTKVMMLNNELMKAKIK